MKKAIKALIIWTSLSVVVFLAGSFLWNGFTMRGGKGDCVINLEMIEDAKIRWMKENHKTLYDIPKWGDITPYFRLKAQRSGWKNGIPVCPQGGTYIIEPVIEYPRCSIGGVGHSLSSDAFPSPFHP